MTSGLGRGDSLAASIQRSIKPYCGKRCQHYWSLPTADCSGNEVEAFALANKHTLSRTRPCGHNWASLSRLQSACSSPSTRRSGERLHCYCTVVYVRYPDYLKDLTVY